MGPRDLLVVAAVGFLAAVVPAPAGAADRDPFDGVVVLTRGDSLGTGFYVGDGLVVTAHHVVEGSAPLRVRADGEEAAGTVVSVDEDLDLALVETDLAGDVRVLAEEDPGIGDEVTAVGAAEGSLSVTRGIVSGFRTVDGTEYVQTDAAVNGGNSGGPLVDADGSVVGVVVSRLSEAEGIGFAVRASQVRAFVDGPRRSPTTNDAAGPGGSEDRTTTWLAVGAGVLALGGLLAGSAAVRGRRTRSRARRPAPAIVITHADLGTPPGATGPTEGTDHARD